MATSFTADEIRRELDVLLHSRTFAKSLTLQRLLSFLVLNELQENPSDLSESAIATGALNRRGDFEPTEDSIVRKTMARLRDKLSEYYAAKVVALSCVSCLNAARTAPYFPTKINFRADPPSSRTPRVLLLPFYPINFHDSDFFTDGLLEDLMTGLTGGGRIPLVPPTTARYLREKTGDMREFRRITGADVILDGTVRRLSATSMQITLSWVDGLTAVFDTYLSARCDPNRTSEAVHSLCEQISERLGSNFSYEIQRQIGARHSENPEARSLYLRAQQANRLGTAEGTRTSFAYLQRALELQPDYAAAHALMADGHIYAGISGIGAPRTEMELAIEWAQRALRWAPRLASALAAKGGVQFAFQWDFPSAKRSLTAARSLDPTSDSIHYWSEAVIAASEDSNLAALRMERNAETDNCSPSTAYLAASHCYNAQQWKRAEFWARRAIELDPTYFRPYPFLAGACLEMGRAEEARSFAETARRLSGPNPYTSGMLGVVLARTGRKSEARAVLNEHIASATQYGSFMGRAVICAALDECEEACQAIGEMIEAREPYVAWLHVFPFFQNLRGQSEYQRLLGLRGPFAK